MIRSYKGGLLIYLSLVVMFIGLGILYFLNSSGITIFKNFQTDVVRSQLINNIHSGHIIARDATLPDYDRDNEINIQTIEDGTITIMRKPTRSLKLWGENEYVTLERREELLIERDWTLSVWFKPQTSGSNFPATNEGLLIHGHFNNPNPDNDLGYRAYFQRNIEGTFARIKFDLAIIDNDESHNTVSVLSDAIFDDSWYFFAVTYDGFNLRLYVNDQPVKSIAAQGRIDWDDLTSDGGKDFFQLGKRSSVHSMNLFQGMVRNLAMWSSTLNQDAIEVVRDQGIGFNPLNTMFNYDHKDDLVGFWKMNEYSGTRLYDLSQNGIRGFANLNNRPGLGPLQIWVIDHNIYTYFIKTEFNDFERIEAFR